MLEALFRDLVSPRHFYPSFKKGSQIHLAVVVVCIRIAISNWSNAEQLLKLHHYGTEIAKPKAILLHELSLRQPCIYMLYVN